MRLRQGTGLLLVAIRYSCLICACLVWGWTAQAAEQTRPDSPYRRGEAYADVPATCETVNYWIDHPMDFDGRVTMTVSGKLTAVEWDGVLAYLVMCEEPGVQVMCVTYSKENRNIGDTVLFGGGFQRVGDRQIMLDPCLASKK
jgi:hypothetical protein